MPYILLRGAFPHGGTYVSMDACEIAAKQALGIDLNLVGDSFSVQNSARWVLDTLEGLGWRMVGVAGPINEKILVWTLHKNPVQRSIH
ncbi:hypothetical protein PRIPAC_80385 [Pristionchus pacificus]|uniref:GTP cyclohydrolase 1 feedback regulatory protein n=1 Tax=Pristionchus pacificus TaxID=54126 RepID=A0A454XSY8_PRIPA|nr:hypothetical protein PRIPAC_80385 [Pristionchus pacificus]|eukprot:PDM69992.1 hypothetical protein PRIPAC_49204 [Pristionchus pacificus]